MQKNGFQHVTSAPYHPSSNGLAERAVQMFKRGMKKQGQGSIETKLTCFLLSYRITPQTTTGESPAQLRWGCSLRSHLDLLRLNVGAKVSRAQARQKSQHDQHSQPHQLEIGDTVQVRNYSGSCKWCPGVIIEDIGPISAKVELENGSIVRRHHDQSLARPARPMENSVPWPTPHKIEGRDNSVAVPPVAPEPIAPTPGKEETRLSPSTEPVPVEIPPRRYPAREHKPSTRYQ